MEQLHYKKEKNARLFCRIKSRHTPDIKIYIIKESEKNFALSEIPDERAIAVYKNGNEISL
jgi:hypothetical protein